MGNYCRGDCVYGGHSAHEPWSFGGVCREIVHECQQAATICDKESCNRSRAIIALSLRFSTSPQVLLEMIYVQFLTGYSIRNGNNHNMRSLQNIPCAQFLRQTQILILEILNASLACPVAPSDCTRVVKILAFLDLNKIEHLSKVSFIYFK